MDPAGPRNAVNAPGSWAYTRATSLESVSSFHHLLSSQADVGAARRHLALLFIEVSLKQDGLHDSRIVGRHLPSSGDLWTKAVGKGTVGIRRFSYFALVPPSSRIYPAVSKSLSVHNLAAIDAHRAAR